MVFGFPGRTNQYLPSDAVEQIVESSNPAKIKIRETALQIMDKYMRADEATRIQYASKYARIANYWKKWIGESLGLTKTDALSKKEKFEKEFQNRASEQGKYTDLLNQFDHSYKAIETSSLVLDYFSEIGRRNVELLSVTSNIRRLVNAYESNGVEGYNGFKSRLDGYLTDFYKNYNIAVDKEVAMALLGMYQQDIDNLYQPAVLKNNKGDALSKLIDVMYAESVIVSATKLMPLINGDPASAVAKLKSDPAYKLMDDWQEVIDKEVNPTYTQFNTRLDSLQTVYMKAQMELFPEKTFYPDANSTMRVTYGQVEGFQPADGMCYTPLTYLDGVLAKYKPGDYEFDLPARLIELHESKDYGQYADHTGDVPVCFLGSNHTTGGNSGSPAIDAYGNLVGLNFDRVWEGTMSDINYDLSLCRNIMVDTRYVLFIIDKFAGAHRLIDEMDLVHPKAD